MELARLVQWTQRLASWAGVRAGAGWCDGAVATWNWVWCHGGRDCSNGGCHVGSHGGGNCGDGRRSRRGGAPAGHLLCWPAEDVVSFM